MNIYIKNMLPTRGWQEVKKMFNDKIEKSATINDLNKDASNEIVAREARVKGEVYKELKGLLKQIELAGVDEEVKKPKRLI